MAAFEELNVADKKKEMIAMPRHSFIQMTKLHNVMGRIDYITSTVKQENLCDTATSFFLERSCKMQQRRIC